MPLVMQGAFYMITAANDFVFLTQNFLTLRQKKPIVFPISERRQNEKKRIRANND